METFLLLLLLIEEVIQMQGVNDSSRRNRWTPEDKTRIVMESLTTNIAVAKLCRKVQFKSKCVLQLETEIHRRR